MITTRLGDNKFWIKQVADLSTSLCYGDCIYESHDFTWVDLVYPKLADNGILIIQTDWHTQHLYRNHAEKLGMFFVNHLVWKNEWGNHPKNRFHQCYDDILIYCKGKNWKFYSDRIQVPKATANTKLNPSGRSTKTATAWIEDITLVTTSKERVKLSTGKNIKWQKPLKLYDRIILPFTDISDSVLDPFMGSGSLRRWCEKNNRNYVGIELDEEVYRISLENPSI